MVEVKPGNSQTRSLGFLQQRAQHAVRALDRIPRRRGREPMTTQSVPPIHLTVETRADPARVLEDATA